MLEEDTRMGEVAALAERREGLPWVEKYRPRSLEEVEHQDGVVRALKRSCESANLPHLLFYGPPGTGKTSTILAVARELYGPELIKKRVKELNASDERGISVIREQVKTFAQIAVSHVKSGNYPCPPYKIIILDEADSMTNAAQSALRRLMETYSKVTRFCLICNYVSRIIEPIASRCAKFRFKSLPSLAVKNRISYICRTEGIEASDETLEELNVISRGDMRGAINVLQSAELLLDEGEEVSPDSVREIAGAIPRSELEEFLRECKTTNFSNLERKVKDLVASGYPAGRLIEQLQEVVECDSDIDDVQKSKIAMFMADVDVALVDGSDELLQLLALGSHIIQVLNKAI